VVVACAFRNSQCRSESDVFAGGSEAPVIDARCLVHQDEARIADLTDFEKALTSR